MKAPSHVCLVSLLGRWSQAVTLLADVNLPRAQEDLVSNWEPALFGGGCHLWGWDCPSPSGSGCCLPANLPLVGGWACPQPATSPLVFTQHFVLWVGQAVPYVRTSYRKVLSLSLSLSLFFVSLANPKFGLLSQVSSLRLSSGHSGPVLTLSMYPPPPCSAPTCWWQT